MSDRLTALDALAALPAPTDTDVQELLGWKGDPRMLGYFFTHTNSNASFNAPSEHELLQTKRDSGIWPAMPYLRSLARSDPGRITDWLAAQPPGGQLTTQQAFLYLQLARSVSAPIDGR